MDPMTRLNYGKIYTVEHNVKVCDYGEVAKEDKLLFIQDFKAVWFSRMDGNDGDNINDNDKNDAHEDMSENDDDEEMDRQEAGLKSLEKME